MRCMDCFTGSLYLIAFFVLENTPDFIFLRGNSGLFQDMCKRKNSTSSTISSCCRWRRVLVGVPTLETCTCGCSHVGDVYLWVFPRWRRVIVGVPTLETCTCGCSHVGDVYLWVFPRWRRVLVGVPTLETCTCGCSHVGDVYLWVFPRWRRALVGVPTLRIMKFFKEHT